MTNNFADDSPAYAVLYSPDVSHGWSARVVDLDCGVIINGRCNLTKDPESFAVLYSPQPDNKWLAEIVDIPGCSVSRPEIAQARVAVKDLAKKTLAKFTERNEPAPQPVTHCHYTRPTDLQLYSGRETTILEAVAAAVAAVVTRSLQGSGTTPPAFSVCGYVLLSEDGNSEAPSSPDEPSVS